VIQLADALGLDTVAEGIERAEQAAVLRELGYTPSARATAWPSR